ncbi:MAG: hypothetical protein GY874_17475 [Desulfobacteraceae bacterium]|nr:hypothetical protein [Desulfobacteraceae bacterium]
MKKLFFFSVLLCSFIVLTITGKSFAIEFEVINLSKYTNSSDLFAQLSANGCVVWRGKNASAYEINYYDGETITNISNTPESGKHLPLINVNGHAVWTGLMVQPGKSTLQLRFKIE